MEAGGPKRNRTRVGYRYTRLQITLNNWTPQEYTDLCNWDVTWMVIGKEVGEDGTPHLQAACIIGKQMTMTAIKNVPGMKRAHFESMRGSPESNLIYCSKEDPMPFIKGTMPKPGKRNDLQSAYETLRSGATLREMADQHGVEMIKYSKGFTIVRSLLVGPRTEPPKIIWLYGPTGVGKTRACVEFANQHHGGEYWMSCATLQWLDGYDGQPVAILDDFRGKHCTFSFLLRLLDRYPFRVPFKGGFVEWNPSVIFITCPYSPQEVFEVRGKHMPEDLNQLERRILKVIHLASKHFSLKSIMRIFEEILIAPKPIPPPVIIIDPVEDSDLEAHGDGPEEIPMTQVYESEDELSLESWLTKEPTNK